MFSVDTVHDTNNWPSLTFTKYCAMTVDLRRTVVDQLGYETIEILHNITVIYEQSGPRFIDNSESDARIDYARFGALMFTKVQQTYLSNIELNVGSTHKTRVGACTCVYSPKGKLLKRKKAKEVKVKKDDRRYTISAERLFADPALDTTLRGGDKLLVEEDKRSFISLGATGTQKLFV